MRKYNLLIFCFLLQNLVVHIYGQVIDNYNLSFSRTDDDSFNLRVECSFIAYRDSLRLNFGGGEFSVSDLKVESDNLSSYNHDIEDRTLSIFLKKDEISFVKMKYDYLNITSAFLYAKNGIEIWEPSFNEFFYPFVFGDKCNFSFTFNMPDSLLVVGGYDIRHVDNKYIYQTTFPVISHSGVFALLDKNKYACSEFTDGKYTVEAFYQDGFTIPSHRMSELAELTDASITFFSNIFEPYKDSIHQIKAKPLYIFHRNGYSNRNNINLISASLDKFTTKPDIFPLVHEIGHRWLGEWTLLIEDGTRGAYFIKESLNEYMTLLFIKYYYGDTFFENYIKNNHMKPYLSIKNTSQDKPLIDMAYNKNIIVVYCKGPVLIHEVAEKWGIDNWISFIGEFYRRYKYVPELSYEMFISAMAEKTPRYAKELDEIIRTR